ncbi:1-aminocyclopropane-1-carboxylate oxidase 1 [Canna indica]|uniref:1-aminocyclopropane-1-carboxylate oxidase 1 n=1 Tax=Canna indica TaxID=4628 RepID=A0AAQ3KER4_9LILI|nr:1-aminocyclopropane-1-carboxylate oxidase 1 [Canna indica]
MREVWRGSFHLPMEEKQRYANSPKTYEYAIKAPVIWNQILTSVRRGRRVHDRAPRRHHVTSLQVRRNDTWITVQLVPDAFIINVDDQIQVN